MRGTRPRMLKVNSILREVIAEEVERLSDSRLEMVSITGVETTPNLRHAVVYIDCLAGDPSDAIAALQRASHRLQSAIGEQVRMKYTPILEFAPDPGVTGGERMDAILRSLREHEPEEAERDD